jgi:transposase
LPPSHRKWKQIDQGLESNHHARIVQRQVDQFDPQTLYGLYRGVGRQAYDPTAMLKMVLYMLLKGIASPARWCEEAKLNEAVQWLGYGYQPSCRTWYDFRDRVGDCIEELHKQLIHNAMDQQLLDPSDGVQDGTSIAACASRHRMVNERTLVSRRQVLQELIDGSFGENEVQPMWVPKTMDGRLELALRMDRAREVLDERIKKNAEKPKDKRKDPTNIQVSLSDPEAPLGRDKLKVYRPLYTVQYVIEPTSHLILGYQCEADVSDAGTLVPMIDQLQGIVGGRLRCMMADAAYCTILDLQDCQDRGIDLLAPVQANSFSTPKQNTNGVGLSNREQFVWDEDKKTYRCPRGHELKYHSKQQKKRHGGRSLTQLRYQCGPEHCMNCPLAANCVRNPAKGRTVTRMVGQELLDAQREKMERPEMKARYKLRGQTVERGFADAKGNRRFDRYHGRGLRRARAETGLLVVAQNILRLDRLQRDKLTTDEIAA